MTDLFCGAGGSSLGAEAAGMTLTMAANHWSTAIEVHQNHFTEAGHDCADISQADPRRYPRTNVLIASPECTNHSQARGVSRKKQQPELWDAPDPTAERSRATMWDVCRFAEQMLYDFVIVENVWEATKWVGWPAWHVMMKSLGYEHTVLSHNSMHHGVPQSRDRIYVVFWRDGLKPNLEMEVDAWCLSCDQVRACRQAWKNGRTVGRYRTQWEWRCTTCRAVCEPPTRPAASIIDWDLECPRVGDRARPLVDSTRRRIAAGLERHGYQPIVTAGAGNTHERTPGNRSRSIDQPLDTQQATATSALVDPMIVGMRGTAQGQLDSSARPVTDPLGTLSAGGIHHGLLMRNQTSKGDPSHLVTSTSEPVRALTTTSSQSLLMPYYGNGQAQPIMRPMPTHPTRDTFALIDVDQLVDNCGFRMLTPDEIAAGMAFPYRYISDKYTKRDRVKLAGNAVTPPVMQWICGRVVQALLAA